MIQENNRLRDLNSSTFVHLEVAVKRVGELEKELADAKGANKSLNDYNQFAYNQKTRLEKEVAARETEIIRLEGVCKDHYNNAVFHEKKCDAFQSELAWVRKGNVGLQDVVEDLTKRLENECFVNKQINDDIDAADDQIIDLSRENDVLTRDNQVLAMMVAEYMVGIR